MGNYFEGQALMIRLILGFSLAGLIAYLAWRAHSLSSSGAWAALLTGGLVFGLGGLPWAVLLLLFFVSSSVLSRAFARRKAGLSEKFSKGSQRDWAQVFANGGLGAFLAVLIVLPGEKEWLWVAYTGAMAAVNADTWATELGVLSPAAPPLITNGRIVEPGTSGGISRQGILASLGGALLIILGALLFTSQAQALALATSGLLGGLAGSLFDSLLGATVQAIYRCPVCEKETERSPRHSCGAETFQVRGWRWLNNDAVNFACSLLGALVAWGVWNLLRAG